MTDQVVIDEELAAAVDDLFADQAPAAHAELDEGAGPSLALWELTEQLGFSRIGIPEDVGGSGGSLIDLLTVLLGAARHAAPLPLAESYLAATLLAGVGASVPPGIVTIARPEHTEQSVDGDTISLRQVPWGQTASCVVAIVPDSTTTRILAVDPGPWVTRTGEDLAGEPTAQLTIGSPEVVSESPVSADEHHWLGALCRTAQIAGALQKVAELTQRYTEEREQFGKPIGRFQAVQQHIVTVAQAAEITTTSLWNAAHAWSSGAEARHFEVANAKLVANESARVAARAAHQAHGAIGMTREYPLHRYTRRLGLWRAQFGTERQLATTIGRAVSAAPSFARILSDADPDVAVSWPT